uniref:Structural maintenance of chromosomes protein 1A n=1 Tax=Cacopsylla melanoneura TaxID=428564 RepID=A0A8D9B645_9HEMI
MNLDQNLSPTPLKPSPSAVLKAFEVVNFKSFKGQRYVPIQGKFVCIVGPNGVGKSNLMDAICFGLGCDPSVMRVSKPGDIFCDDKDPGENCVSVSLVFSIRPGMESSTPIITSTPHHSLLPAFNTEDISVVHQEDSHRADDRHRDDLLPITSPDEDLIGPTESRLSPDLAKDQTVRFRSVQDPAVADSPPVKSLQSWIQKQQRKLSKRKQSERVELGEESAVPTIIQPIEQASGKDSSRVEETRKMTKGDQMTHKPSGTKSSKQEQVQLVHRSEPIPASFLSMEMICVDPSYDTDSSQHTGTDESSDVKTSSNGNHTGKTSSNSQSTRKVSSEHERSDDTHQCSSDDESSNTRKRGSFERSDSQRTGQGQSDSQTSSDESVDKTIIQKTGPAQASSDSQNSSDNESEKSSPSLKTRSSQSSQEHGKTSPTSQRLQELTLTTHASSDGQNTGSSESSSQSSAEPSVSQLDGQYDSDSSESSSTTTESAKGSTESAKGSTKSSSGQESADNTDTNPEPSDQTLTRELTVTSRDEESRNESTVGEMGQAGSSGSTDQDVEVGHISPSRSRPTIQIPGQGQVGVETGQSVDVGHISPRPTIQIPDQGQVGTETGQPGIQREQFDPPSDSTHSSDFFVSRPRLPTIPSNVNVPVAETTHLSVTEGAQTRSPSNLSGHFMTPSNDRTPSGAESVNDSTSRSVESNLDWIRQDIVFTRNLIMTSPQSFETEFKINNEIVTPEIYQELLRKLGINNQANVFLIFQGRVEELALKKPMEMTLLFETISGSIQYKPEYDRISSQINSLLRQDMKVKTKLKLLRQERLELNRTVLADRAFRQIEDDSDEATLIYYLFKLQTNEQHRNACQSELTDKEKLLAEYKAELTDREIALKSKKKELGAVQRDLAGLEQGIHNVEMSFVEQKCGLIKIQETVDQARRKAACCEQQYRSVEKQNKHDMDSVNQLNNTLRTLKQTHEEKIAELETYERQIFTDTQKLSEYETLKQEATKRAGHFMLQLDSSERERQHLQEELNKLKDRELMNSERKDRLERQIAVSEQRVESIGINLKKCQSELEARQTAKADLESSVLTARSKTEGLTEQLTELNYEISQLKGDKVEQSSGVNRQNILNALQQEFGKDKVFGRICALIQIPDREYALAIWRIILPHQYKIVVDTSDTGMQCIQFLKRKQLGVETFLPLDMARNRRLESRYRTLGARLNLSVKLMIDLIKFDPRIEPAIVWVTNNALVCRKPEEAQFVAYEAEEESYKNAVSLDGTYYNKNGLIYGGNVERLARSYDERKLQLLKQDRDKILDELRTLQRTIHAGSDLPSLQVEIRGLEKRVTLYTEELELEEKRLDQLQSELTSLSSSRPMDQTFRQQTELEMAEVDQRIADIKRSIAKIEREIFESFCADVGVVDIESFEKNQLRNRSDLQNELQKIADHINKVDNLLSYESEKSSNKVEQSKTKWESVLKQVEQLEAKLTAEKAKLNSLRSSLKQKNERKAELGHLLKQVEAELKECRHSVEASRRVTLEFSHIVSSLTAKLSTLKAERHQILLDAKSSRVSLGLKHGSLDIVDAVDSQAGAFDSHSPQYNREIDEIELDYSPLEDRPDLLNINLEDANEMEAHLETEMIGKQLDKEKCRPKRRFEREKLSAVVEKIEEGTKEEKKIMKRTRELQKKFNEVRKQREAKFCHLYSYVSGHIDRTYKMLTQTIGCAYLDIRGDSVDPYLSGIEFSCIPHGRSFVTVDQLSGGERTMAALALVFTIWKYNPAPFILVDEIDAALDVPSMRNIVDFIYYTPGLRVIAVTLNKIFYSQADTLFGLTTKDPPNPVPQNTCLFTLNVSNKARTGEVLLSESGTPRSDRSYGTPRSERSLQRFTPEGQRSPHESPHSQQLTTPQSSRTRDSHFVTPQESRKSQLETPKNQRFQFSTPQSRRSLQLGTPDSQRGQAATASASPGITSTPTSQSSQSPATTPTSHLGVPQEKDVPKKLGPKVLSQFQAILADIAAEAQDNSSDSDNSLAEFLRGPDALLEQLTADRATASEEERRPSEDTMSDEMTAERAPSEDIRDEIPAGPREASPLENISGEDEIPAGPRGAASPLEDISGDMTPGRGSTSKDVLHEDIGARGARQTVGAVSTSVTRDTSKARSKALARGTCETRSMTPPILAQISAVSRGTVESPPCPSYSVTVEAVIEAPEPSSSSRSTLPGSSPLKRKRQTTPPATMDYDEICEAPLPVETRRQRAQRKQEEDYCLVYDAQGQPVLDAEGFPMLQEESGRPKQTRQGRFTRGGK